MKWKIVLLVSVMLVSACSTIGSADNCAGWKPIRLEGQSITGLTDRDAQAVLTHNVYGAKRGCW